MDLQTISTIAGFCSPIVAIFAAVFAAGRKAEKYAQLVAKVEKLSKDIEDAQDKLLELSGTSGKASSLQKELTSASSKLSAADVNIADLKLKISLLENIMQTQIKQWASLENNVTGVIKDASGVDVKLEHLKEAIDRNIVSLENLRERVSAIEARCSSTHRK